MDIRIACFGAGYIAGRHLAALSSMPGVQIAGVADVEIERAQGYTARFGGRPYSDWRALLEAERPDAAYICLPPFAHGEPEQALIELGVPFFVEKPLSTGPELPERIGAQVSERNLLTSVGYHWRYLDTIDRAREIIRRDPPRLAMGYWFDFVPPPAWWVHRETSGGQMVEQTTHIFDLARYLLGEPERVFGAACRAGLECNPQADIDAASAVTLQFPGGALAVIASTCLPHYPHRIGLWLYAQHLIVECQELSLTVEMPTGRQSFEPTIDPYVQEDRAFVQALQAGDTGAIRVPYGEALRTHRLVMRACESAQIGEPLATRS